MVQASIRECFSQLGQPKVIWRDNKGNIRVHASIYKASYISITIWMKDPDLSNPTTQAVILLKLHRKMRDTVAKLSRYIL